MRCSSKEFDVPLPVSRVGKHSKKYKDTLRLPKTSFPMHPKHGSDKRCLDSYGGNEYKIMRESRKDASLTFVLHDGPPYANGDIHMGHALNKILKDITVKVHYFSGQAVHYRPGWDCHGFPIEQKVLHQFREPPTSPVEIRNLCRKLAEEQIELQKSQFQSLGVSADWNNPYKTMDFQFEADIFRSLADLALRGCLQRRERPVLWNWAAKTVITDTDVVYKEKTDRAIYVAFPLDDNLNLLVWTTTPWTLPANVAVALGPQIDYVVLTVGNKKYVVAADLAEGIAKKLGVEVVTYPISLQFLKGHKVARHPLHPNRHSTIIFDDYVKTDQGTGCVHIAPGHGAEDYRIGLENNLPVLNPVGLDGKYTNEIYELITCPEDLQQRVLAGKRVLGEGNASMVEIAKLQGTLVFEEDCTHNYPYCDRTDVAAIFLTVSNWYLDFQSFDIARRIDEAVFVPPQGKNRLKAMVGGRSEWCLSRQRSWGVPIALFYLDGVPWLDANVLEHTASVFEKYGCDCWWTAPDEFFLPPYYHDYIRNKKVERCMDTLDVWFDSGLSWTLLEPDADDKVKATYLEGNDQYRGWFNSSAVLGCMLQDTVPFDEVITHGFVVDKNGEKMAKSKGNVISPQYILDKYHVDVLRTWVAMTDYREDIRLGHESIAGAKDAYLKIRNTLRYMVANIGNKVSMAVIWPVDEWILAKGEECLHTVWGEFIVRKYYSGFHRLLDFVTGDLSSLWMNAVKDRLYCGGEAARKSVVAVMQRLLRKMILILSPIMTVTIDELCSHLPDWYAKGNVYEQPSSVVLAEGPYVFKNTFDVEYWKEALDKFNQTFDTMKQDGCAKDKLEVYIVRCLYRMTRPGGSFMYGSGPDRNKRIVVEQPAPFTGVEDWFGVSHFFDHASGGGGYYFMVGDSHFGVYKAEKDNRRPSKCPRCWKWVAPKKDALCERCQRVLN